MSEKSNDKNNINSRSEHLRNTTDTVKEIAEQLGIDPDLLTLKFSFLFDKMHDAVPPYIETTSALKKERNVTSEEIAKLDKKSKIKESDSVEINKLIKSLLEKLNGKGEK